MKIKSLTLLVTLAVSTLVVAQEDIQTTKTNVPAKKESFAAKIERYQNEGFKAAVVISISPLATARPSSGSGPTMLNEATDSKDLVLEGETRMDKSDFTSLAEAYATKMNETYATDIFVVVDPAVIPTRSTKVAGDVPDWGQTIYKMVVSYSIYPKYQFDKSGDKYTAKYLVNQAAPIIEYINDKKGIKMKYPVRMGGLGFYTVSHEGEDLAGLTTIDELNAIVNPPLGTDLAAKLTEAMHEKMPDYLKKIK